MARGESKPSRRVRETKNLGGDGKPRKRHRLRTTVIVVAVVLVVVAVAPLVAVWGLSHGRTYTPNSVPKRETAIVFGAQIYADGTPSPFLKARLDVAVALYQAGRYQAVIVSGTKDGGYDEPKAMRDYLVAQGVPADLIVQDGGGLDTFSTCARAKKVYGATDVVLISQTYHLPRAIATCRLLGLDAIGSGDARMQQDYPDMWRAYTLREWPAELKLFFDYVFRSNDNWGPPDDALDKALHEMVG